MDVDVERLVLEANRKFLFDATLHARVVNAVSIVEHENGGRMTPLVRNVALRAATLALHLAEVSDE
jgi:hypothetical protein